MYGIAQTSNCSTHSTIKHMSKDKGQLPMRQVHLDFHTSPHIGDVGKNFDAQQFAATMKQAHVNSVTVFAKCHHGHLYYNTTRPERHPGLRRGLDLLERQVESLHSQGIRAPIYLSVQCDEYAANTHPEWVAQKPDGSPVKRGDSVFIPGWQILDMSSPYQDFLVEQTVEVLKRFKPVDGIFFDMCWDQPSVSKWAIAGMIGKKLNPQSEADQMKYAHQVSLAYMQRLHDLVKKQSKNATVYFNGRVLFNIEEELKYQAQIEIEALPSGGWGYMFFPKNVRFVRTFPLPYLGMTARFHKGWADFGGLKPYAALEYETSQMIAHGAACSIGDQLHPRGELDPAAYELIGRTYQRVEQREPWLIGAKPVAQIGVLIQPDADADIHVRQDGGPEEGATRMLTQLKHQFNFISESSDWREYELLILPDKICMSKVLADRLHRHIAAGKALLTTGTSGLSADGRSIFLPGIKVIGPSPFTTTYIRFGREISDGIPQTDHVMYDRSVRVIAGRGTESLASVVEPYFERSWDRFSSHYQTPPDKRSQFSAALQKDRIGYIPYPVFSSYANHANLACRWLVSALIDRLLPDPLARVKAPSSTEVSVMRQAEAGRTIVHLLQYCPERRGNELDLIEDIVPLFNVELSLKSPKKPSRVYLLSPQPTAIEFDWRDGRVEVVVPRILGHEMVIIDQ
jgi:Hypothetical glycosyl hydrolase 6/Beta-galactosidase trimerisation domain